MPRWKTHRRGNQVAIPLRGYVVCNKFYALNPEEEEWGRNPLTGLCGLQPADLRVAGGGERHEVAIPLRGYVVCNYTLTTTSLSAAIQSRMYLAL